MGKIWSKEEIHFDVSGRPYRVKAGLFEKLRNDQERINRLSQGCETGNQIPDDLGEGSE